MDIEAILAYILVLLFFIGVAVVIVYLVKVENPIDVGGEEELSMPIEDNTNEEQKTPAASKRS